MNGGLEVGELHTSIWTIQSLKHKLVGHDLQPLKCFRVTSQM